MVSNTLLFDPLLVRYLAEELDQRLRGRACAAAPLFASDRSAVLVLDRGEALQMDLHPTRGWIRLVPWEAAEEELEALCLGVEAPPDERILRIRLRAGDRFRVADLRLVVELHSNQWNALLVSEEDDRIHSVLRTRTAGDRSLRSGQPYLPPAAAPRYGISAKDPEEAWTRWRKRLPAADPASRRAVLLAEFAYTGALNADWILAPLSEHPTDQGSRAGFERWWWLRGMPRAAPSLVRGPRRTFPYPVPLEGLPSEPIDSLLAGMERVAAEAPGESTEPLLQEQERWVRRRMLAAERRLRRLEEEMQGTGESQRLRSWGDLLLANLHTVPRGAAEARVPDWDGEERQIPLDPSLSPAENAARLYDEARKRARAEARLPDLLQAARTEMARWQEALAVLGAGELPDWVAREMERDQRSGAGSAAGGNAVEVRPYRTYRTSGQLEVRVGRSARDNDRLTFGHSRPNDVWLHARSVPGSHVILRWNDPDNAPPARDLEEAATLAALFSRARTSALVPVDWTRRKYVRKPRGAPPGAVIPNQVKTLFVEPDAEVEERMRD